MKADDLAEKMAVRRVLRLGDLLVAYWDEKKVALTVALKDGDWEEWLVFVLAVVTVA